MLDSRGSALKMSNRMKPRSLLFAALALASCDASNDVVIGTAQEPLAPISATASATSSAAPKEPVPAWVGIPQTDAVAKVINRSKAPAYSGKTGTLKGRITMTGDPAPKTDWTFPKDCAEAAAMYGKAFRVGQDKGLADVLVAVSGYEAFVPPEAPAVQVKVQGCAYESRTVAAMFGQRLEIVNIDPVTSYMPYLDGAEYRAVMVAMPGGAPIKVFPNRPAINYVLRDYQGRSFLQADVFVLKFSTLDVTALDGRYEIGRIPVGKVRVDAVLPALAHQKVGQEIEIHEGENALDLAFTYDAKKDTIAPRQADPWARGTDPNRPAATAGQFGAPAKTVFPRDVPR